MENYRPISSEVSVYGNDVIDSCYSNTAMVTMGKQTLRGSKKGAYYVKWKIRGFIQTTWVLCVFFVWCLFLCLQYPFSEPTKRHHDWLSWSSKASIIISKHLPSVARQTFFQFSGDEIAITGIFDGHQWDIINSVAWTIRWHITKPISVAVQVLSSRGDQYYT